MSVRSDDRPGAGGSADSRPLPFTAPWLLAPMEGVTDPVFRRVVLALHRPEDLGGVFTEFVRVVDYAMPSRRLQEHRGEVSGPIPVGLQLMGSDLESMAESARRAAAIGVPVVDLNFGCPAKGALRGCAGSAVLKDPAALERMVKACVDAVPAPTPVTAKIRAGYDDASQVEDLARAAEAGGAAMLTIHCRTRAEGYQDEVFWERIARAVAAIAIPVCGNGGVTSHDGLERMRRETGCRYVMVGRAALGDPWIFSGRSVEPAEAVGFLWRYARAMAPDGPRREGFAVGRIKQLLRYWVAGGIRPEERDDWLREASAARFLERLAIRAGKPAPARL